MPDEADYLNITIRLTRSDRDKVDAIAEKNKRSRAFVLQEWIQRGLKESGRTR